MRNETLLTPKELFSHGTTQAEQWARWREVGSGSPIPARRAGPDQVVAWGSAVSSPKSWDTPGFYSFGNPSLQN